MATFDKFPPDSELMRMRGLQLLYDFHALREPALHPRFVEVVWVGPEPALSGRNVEPALETFLLEDNKVRQKALFIKGHYRPVMRALLRDNPNAGPDELAAYCQEEVEDFDLPILGSKSVGLEVDAASILPEAPVLRAMQRSFADCDRSRCVALESFILRLERENLAESYEL